MIQFDGLHSILSQFVFIDFISQLSTNSSSYQILIIQLRVNLKPWKQSVTQVKHLQESTSDNR